MGLHKDFPAFPYIVLPPDVRWYPDEFMFHLNPTRFRDKRTIHWAAMRSKTLVAFYSIPFGLVCLFLLSQQH